MNEVEVKDASFMGESNEKLKDIHQVTGGVPLQIETLSKCNFLIDMYKTEELKRIVVSLNKLISERTDKDEQQSIITESAVACVF